MSFTLRPHEYRRQPNTDKAILTGLHAYVRFAKEGDDNPPVFVQSGEFWDVSGNRLDPDKLPEWVHEEVKKLTPRTRKEIGLPELVEEEDSVD